MNAEEMKEYWKNMTTEEMIEFEKENGNAGRMFWEDPVVWGTIVTAVVKVAYEIEVLFKGGEVVIRQGGKTQLRINPTGNPDGDPPSDRPHYHRRPGIGKHRPWQGGW
ncbi:MAG: hypothetical protein AB1414_17935 [bacterium]